MSKFLVETRKPIGVAVYTYYFDDDLKFRSINILDSVTTPDDFLTLKKEIEEIYSNDARCKNFTIINIIYFKEQSK